MSDPTVFLTAVAPTFEVHVNSPLNHRGFDNPTDPFAIAASVNLTYGLNLEFGHNSLLTLGIVTPVTGPLPFSFETLVLFNYRFGRNAAGTATGDLGVGHRQRFQACNNSPRRHEAPPAQRSSVTPADGAGVLRSRSAPPGGRGSTQAEVSPEPE